MSPGKQIGPYIVEGPLGSGGMGAVYKARDTRLNRIVAIKVSQERFNERFEREARAIAALNHPNICTLYDIGPDYLVMEYVEGHPFRGPLPLPLALQYAAQAAGALQAAHSKGVIHRDFKPANVLIAKSGVKLLDFGLASFAAQAAASDNTATIVEPLTKDNSILGTLQYMSPEQLEGKPADARSDIFAFGLVLYEAIAGKPAFTASSQASLIAAILKEEPPALTAPQLVVPPALERVVRKCLAKDPDARWQTAADLRDELQWIAQTDAASVSLPATPQVARRTVLKWIPAAAALATGFAGGAFWRSFHTSNPGLWTATRMSGPSTAHFPAISPDGQLVAFLTVVDNVAQVAVMKSDGSSWTRLTNQKGAGYACNVAWAPDGSKIYFARYFDKPRGVYSVPALGGDPSLLLENAFGGYPLPDGSLIVAKLAANGDFQIQRFFPESGRTEPLPAYLKSAADRPYISVLPGGREIAFYGFTGSAEHGGSPQLYVLALATRKARVAGASVNQWAGYFRPVAATPDGKSLITVIQSEDQVQVVKTPADGSAGGEPLFSLAGPDAVDHLDVARDGSVYLGIWRRPTTLLRFDAAGGDPQQTLLPASQFSGNVVALPDGRILYPGIAGGKGRLLVNTEAGDWRPFVQTAEETFPPLALSAAGSLAFKLGTPPSRQIAIASARDGRIVQRISLDTSEVASMALSPDGRTLYYAAAGLIWSLDTAKPAKPSGVMEGNSLVMDPAGQFLYVQQLNQDPGQLVRVALKDKSATPIQVPDGMQLTNNVLAANAVDARGRVLTEVSSADSFFYSAALFDPARSTATRIPVRFEGDVWGPGWGPDGRIVALGAPFTSSIWRYHRL